MALRNTTIQEGKMGGIFRVMKVQGRRRKPTTLCDPRSELFVRVRLSSKREIKKKEGRKKINGMKKYVHVCHAVVVS